MYPQKFISPNLSKVFILTFLIQQTFADKSKREEQSINPVSLTVGIIILIILGALVKFCQKKSDNSQGVSGNSEQERASKDKIESYNCLSFCFNSKKLKKRYHHPRNSSSTSITSLQTPSQQQQTQENGDLQTEIIALDQRAEAYEHGLTIGSLHRDHLGPRIQDIIQYYRTNIENNNIDGLELSTEEGGNNIARNNLNNNEISIQIPNQGDFNSDEGSISRVQLPQNNSFQYMVSLNNRYITSASRSRLGREPIFSQRESSRVNPTEIHLDTIPSFIIKTNQKCCNCKTRESVVQFLPCGHIASCAECSILIMNGKKQCPQCNVGINEAKHMHGIVKQKQYQDDSVDDVCMICLDKKRTCGFLPCKHKSACRECAHQVLKLCKKCPICRQFIFRVKEC